MGYAWCGNRSQSMRSAVTVHYPKPKQKRHAGKMPNIMRYKGVFQALQLMIAVRLTILSIPLLLKGIKETFLYK